MRPRIFTFRYSSIIGGFDDTPLREYVANQEVLAFREHFFMVNEVPHLLCVVETQAPLVVSHAKPSKQNDELRNPTPSDRRHTERRGGDPTQGLDEPERLLFQSIREWRSETAREEGVPPYVILTNRELRSIVEARPDSPTTLGHVHGIGPMKVKRHGRSILRRLWPDGVPGETSGTLVTTPEAGPIPANEPDKLTKESAIGSPISDAPSEAPRAEAAS